MTQIWCQACGAGITAGPGHECEDCPSCGAVVDLSPWRAIEAVERIKAAIETEQDLPGLLVEKVGALLASQARRLRKALPERPAPRPPEIEPALEGPAEPEPVASAPVEPPSRTRVVPAGPGLWERLGPAFVENLGFALAGFLIVAGAVFFATTAWTTMTGAQRLLVVSGGLALLGGVLLAAGRLLNRGATLPEVERVLLFVSGSFASVAAVPAGDLLAQSILPGLVAGYLSVALAFFVGREMARVVDRALRHFLPAALALGAVGVMAAPFTAGGLPYHVAGASVFLLLGTVVYARVVVPAGRVGVGLTLGPAALLGFALLAFSLRSVYAEVEAGLSALRALAALGVGIAALGAGLTCVDGALRRRAGSGGVVLPLFGLALGVAGTAIALGDDVSLAFASAFGAWAGLRAGLVLPVPWLAIPGLGLAAVAYFQAPAPVREALLRLRDQAAMALGYANRPLPLGYYGITFLPYVATCALAGLCLIKRGRSGLGRVFLTWTTGCGLGLAALALLASGNPMGSDLRPPTAVLAAQGGLFLWAGIAAKGRFMLLGGALGVTGSVACGLGYLKAGQPLSLLVLSGLGILGVSLGAWLSRRPRPGRALLRLVSLECAGLLAVGLFVLAFFDALLGGPDFSWGGLPVLVLGLLLGWVAHAFSSPLAVTLSGLALAAAGAQAGGLWFPLEPGGGEMLGAALVSFLPFICFRKVTRVVRPFRHPFSLRPGETALCGSNPSELAQAAAWVTLQAQLVGLLLWISRYGWGGWSWPLALGLALGAVALYLVGLAGRQDRLVIFAAGQIVAASLAACGALGGNVAGTAGLLCSAIGISVAWAPAWVPGLVGRARFGEERLRALLPFFSVPFVVWSLVLVADRFGAGRLSVHGPALGFACLLVPLVVRLALRGDLGGAIAAGLPAGLLFGPAALGALLWIEAGHSWYPLGLLGAGIATGLWAGRSVLLAVPAGLHVLAAFSLAVVLALSGESDQPGALLAAFLLLAALGRTLAVRIRFLGGLLLLASLLASLSLVLFPRYLQVQDSYQPALWIALAGAALLAGGFPVLGVCRSAARVFAWPILGLAWLCALLVAFLVAWDPSEAANFPGGQTLIPFRVAGLTFVLASSTVLLLSRKAWRQAVFVAALALGSFLWAPVNLVLGGAGLWRPDVEVVLLGLLLAWTLPEVSDRQGREPKAGRLGHAWSWPILFSLAGVLLTWSEWRHPSTPIAFFALAATGLVVAARDRREGTGLWFGLGWLAAMVVLAAFFRPLSGPLAIRAHLLLAAASSVAALVLREGALRLRRIGCQVVPVGELAPAAGLGGLFAFGLVSADALSSLEPAGLAEIALALLAVGIPTGLAALGALRGRAPWLIHAAVAGLLLLGLFLGRRTDFLDLFEGWRVHVLALFGGSLILASYPLRAKVGRLLAFDGLVLVLPAVLAHTPSALGLEQLLAGSWSALGLACLVAAAGAHRLELGYLWWLVLVLGNLVLFSVWRNLGLVDPTFYGVAPGLTLIGGALALGNKTETWVRLTLLTPGISLLYGPVALQVLRAGQPVHALVLFGLGLATVLLGLGLERSLLLVLGMAVVVLDVVVYLASRGFETDFLGAALLIGAGLLVLAAATSVARRRRAGRN